MPAKDACVVEPMAKLFLANAVEGAINFLFEKDAFLLKHNVSERAITHRLALHLTQFFPSYDVDCEYNNDIDAKNGRKYIAFLIHEAESLNLINPQEELDEDFVYRSVFPDIIVHKRGKNGDKNNLLIIEIKKTSSTISEKFDFEKLKKYTSSNNENHLAYAYGLFLQLPVGTEFQKDKRRLVWFKNGICLEGIRRQ